MPYKKFDPALATEIDELLVLGSPDPTSRMPTLAEVRTEIFNASGKREDIDPAEPGNLTKLDGWINEGLEELASMLDLYELKAQLGFSTASNWLYILPAGVDVVEAVTVEADGMWLTEDRPLRKITDLGAWRALPDDSAFFAIDGRPKIFFQWMKMLALWPQPSAGLNISADVSVEIQKLVAADDRPPLHLKWKSAFISLALSITLSRLGEPDRAAVEHNRALASIRSKLSQRDKEASGAVGGLRFPRTEREVFRSPYRDRSYDRDYDR